VKFKFWEDHLHTHPDKKFSGLILRGLEGGGFQREKITLHSAKGNMSSATKQKEVKLKAQWIGVVSTQETAQQLGLFGAIPKKERVNKWRLILNLLSPADRGVNDRISKEDCSMLQ